MKRVLYGKPPEPALEEKNQPLGSLDIGDCFRFLNGISFDDALKTDDTSFFFVTGPNGAKPPEGKVSCITFDLKQPRVLDGDRLVIKHDAVIAIKPALKLEIKAAEALEENPEN